MMGTRLGKHYSLDFFSGDHQNNRENAGFESKIIKVEHGHRKYDIA